VGSDTFSSSLTRSALLSVMVAIAIFGVGCGGKRIDDAKRFYPSEPLTRQFQYRLRGDDGTHLDGQIVFHVSHITPYHDNSWGMRYKQTVLISGEVGADVAKWFPGENRVLNRMDIQYTALAERTLNGKADRASELALAWTEGLSRVLFGEGRSFAAQVTAIHRDGERLRITLEVKKDGRPLGTYEFELRVGVGLTAVHGRAMHGIVVELSE